MKKLTRDEMKNVVGGLNQQMGGTCAYSQPNSSASGGMVVTYNVSIGDAQSGAGAFGGHWCCSSCSTASWYGA